MSLKLRAADVQVYRAAEQLSEIIIYLMVVFSPWALGSTERWAIQLMNQAGYLLGLLLLVKLAIRKVRGYRQPRWGENHNPAGRGWSTERNFVRSAAALTILLLAFCLVSALNARATFNEHSLTFSYQDCIRWLPHSLDSAATWFAFWTYLGLACFFWALRDWLLGKSSAEERAEWQGKNRAGAPGRPDGSPSQPGRRPLQSGEIHLPLPERLRRLLWLLAINGALLGAEAIVQRAAGSPRLLFLVRPRIHQTAEGQFGPYAYRSNAAQYFNLLWPVALGFWWTLNRRKTQRAQAPAGPRSLEKPAHKALLVAAAVMAACPVISTTRAGAMISFGIGGAAALVFAATLGFTRGHGPNSNAQRLLSHSLVTFFMAAMALGLALGWKELQPRLSELNDGFAGREEMYEAARPIARDYPLFGIGPGAFETVSQLYPRPDIFWPTQLHNDWLETRITFGWVGSALIALLFLTVLARWWTCDGIHGGRRFVVLIWLALGGCLLHARFDFPFQIHSTLFLFVLLCAVLFTLSRRPERRG